MIKGKDQFTPPTKQSGHIPSCAPAEHKYTQHFEAAAKLKYLRLFPQDPN